MKTLNQYIKEKLIINKDYKDYRDDKIIVKSFDELRKIIDDRYDKLGGGTKENPIDFNDIDVSNLDSFCNNKYQGIFSETKFKYIDISNWDVSNIPLPAHLYSLHKESRLLTSISLKSIGFCAVPSPNLSYLSSMIFRNSSNDFGDNPASR